MKSVVFAYSRRGLATARRIGEALSAEENHFYCVERLAGDGFLPVSKPVYEECFHGMDAMIFVGSCGIAVRQIAPFVSDKRKDPAVVCIDELGRFVIPILSGHIGGANRLAQRLAQHLGATPVITTATDINHRFSVDAWASEKDCCIDSMETAKRISAAILEEDVPLASDFPICSVLPAGVIHGDAGPLGIYITYRTVEPFHNTLRLIPRVLNLGIGCRKGTSALTIRQAVHAVLREYQIDPRALAGVYSIDLKSREEGLLQFCEEEALPVEFYSAEQLRRLQGVFTPSEFVNTVTGVDNVCERSAMLGAEKLIVRKTAFSGVTVAVAMRHWEVQFG